MSATTFSHSLIFTSCPDEHEQRIMHKIINLINTPNDLLSYPLG